MSDPFSVAGSAVGVISLGLQVCQQVASYCQAYKSYDEDIKKIGSRAESLQRPLKGLRELIEEARAKNPEIANDFADKALSLQSLVNSLRGAIDRIIPTMTANTQGKFRGQLNKVIYPFRRETLRDMLRDLDGIQLVLQTSLSIYSTQKISRLGLMQETIIQEVQQIRLDLRHAPENRLISPDSLRTWCGCHTECALSIRDTHMASHASLVTPRISKFECSNLQRSLTQYQFSKCRSRTKSYKYLSAVLRVAATVSFSLSNGPGEFSIVPALRLQSIIKYAGSLPESMMPERLGISLKTSASEFGKIIDTLICRLQCAFTEGQAAPSNVFQMGGPPNDSDYSSFLDLLDYWCLATCQEKLSSLHRLTRFLVDHGALPDNTRMGPLRWLLMQKFFREEDYSLVRYLVLQGGPLNLDNLRYWSPAQRLNLRYIFFRDANLISSTEAARIILRESEEELKAALESGRISPIERLGSLSLLELAFGWPTGMQILLKSGSNIQGISLQFFSPWSTPRKDHPTFDRWYRSYELLLHAGCPITCGDLSSTGSQKNLFSLFLNELTRRRRALGKLAISCLPQKLIRDFKLHEQALPDIHAPKICTELAIRGRTFDSSLLVKYDEESLYHSPCLSAKIMEELLKAGFKDFDSPNSQGLTPIMIEDGFLMTDIWMHTTRLKWLVSKGADTRTKLPLSNTTVAHLISVRITFQVLAFLFFSKHPSPDDALQFLDELISRDKDYLFPNSCITDNCTCACSPGGCTTLSAALRQTFFLVQWASIDGPDISFPRLLRCLVEWTQVGPGINRALMRFLTFDALGLKHTCCIEINRDLFVRNRREVDEMISREEEEIAEILEEDKQGIETLEQLVGRFEAKFKELGLPIWVFLEGYWHTYMVEFLSGFDPYDEEHDQDTRNLGVILQREENPLDRVSLLIGAQIQGIELDVLGC